MSVDAKALRDKITEIALASPEFVYQKPDDQITCVYTHADGEPGCLVGQGMAALDAQISYTDENNVGADAEDLYIKGYIAGDSSDVRWLWEVQQYQDAGYSWLQAVMLANTGEENRSLGL